ncbi:hypothetical protein GEMRC1_011710 [Eukaryota sp. GEM-RC1]
MDDVVVPEIVHCVDEVVDEVIVDNVDDEIIENNDDQIIDLQRNRLYHFEKSILLETEAVLSGPDSGDESDNDTISTSLDDFVVNEEDETNIAPKCINYDSLFNKNSPEIYVNKSKLPQLPRGNSTLPSLPQFIIYFTALFTISPSQMQLKVRFLNPSRIIDVDVDPTDKVSVLKSNVYDQLKETPESFGLKLVFKGRVLDDGQELSHYNMTSATPIIAVKTSASKEPAEAPPKESVSSPSTQTDTFPEVQVPQQQTPAGMPPAFSLSQLQQAQQAPQAQHQQPAPAFEVDEEALNFMMDMGFESDQCKRALELSHNDTSRAIDLLQSGDLSAQPPQSAPSQPPSGQQANNPLMGLLNIPQWGLLRQQLLSDPNALRSFITELGRSNPQLGMFIQQNPQALAQLLATDPPEGGGHVLELSPEDNQAIERIMAITGAPKEVVAQAYFSCDKSEELAINFVLDTSEDWRE